MEKIQYIKPEVELCIIEQQPILDNASLTVIPDDDLTDDDMKDDNTVLSRRGYSVWDEEDEEDEEDYY